MPAWIVSPWLRYGAVAVIAGVATWFGLARPEIASLERSWAEERAAHADVARQAEATQRDIERQDAADKEGNREKAAAELDRARADAAGARTALERLRSEYAGFLRAHQARVSAAAAAGEPAAGETVCMRADLLAGYLGKAERLERSTVEVARFADLANAAGGSAEREHDALRAARTPDDAIPTR